MGVKIIRDNILHILPMDKMSGAERVALLSCKNFSKYTPIIVCGGENLGVFFEECSIKTINLDFKKNKFYLINQLKKIVEINNIKLIHAHDNTASLLAYSTKCYFNLNIKIISHIHNCYPWLKNMNVKKVIDSYMRSKYDLNLLCGETVEYFYKENTKHFAKTESCILSNAIDCDEIIKIKNPIKREDLGIE